jgi:PPM family protein phosphatase
MQSIAKGVSHFGVGRETSEDVFRVDDGLGLYIVCDGARDEDGYWAAETICDVVHKSLRKNLDTLAAYRAAPTKTARTTIEGLLKQAVRNACAEIHRICCVERVRKRSSSALGVVLFVGDYAISAHVGNTRLYLLRGGKVLRLTRDHTYYEEMLRELPKGSQVNPTFKKRLTHAIGDSESVPLAMNSIPMLPGDLLLLCSNGLSDPLSAEGAELVTLCGSGEPDAISARLVDWALKKGSDDNITALVARIVDEGDGATEVRKSLPVEQDLHKQLEMLKSIKIFAAIREDQRAMMKLQGLLTFRQVRAGEVIVQQGSPSDEMFVLIQGRTEVQVDGKRVAQRGAGDVIGEMGFFDRKLRSATIQALEPTSLASIQRWEFDALVQQDWRLGYKILEAVIAAVSEKLEESSSARRDRASSPTPSKA